MNFSSVWVRQDPFLMVALGNYGGCGVLKCRLEVPFMMHISTTK